MKDFHKKESPFQGITGLAGGATGLRMSSAAVKTYIDDIFSTYLWEGNSTEDRNINNGINLSDEGGMVWIKKRNASDDNLVYDTLRGHNERIITNSDTDNGGLGQRLTGFNANGFKLGNNTQVNASSNTYSSWSFRKAPGFFDVVTYTGNGTSDRDISHSLGCSPGFVIVKRTVGGVGDWKCIHRYDFDKYLELNQTQAAASSSADFPSHPTSTTFTVSSDAAVNKNGDSYVAYLFAGGASTAATARSVDFDGSGDYLEAGGGTDMQLGTGDFTIETFVYFDTTSNQSIYDGRPDGVQGAYISLYIDSGNLVFYTDSSTRITSSAIIRKQWYHVALVRNSGTTTLYLNGMSQGSYSDSSDYTVRTDGPVIGIARNLSNNPLNGKLSNYRIVKGTAVYTSSFRPPTEPLTNITNTKLLFCNNSSVTGSTVAPTGGTISSSGDPTASTDSPFDDPAGFKFGDSKEGIIKCGSYVGQSGANKVNLGWEPQWVMVKNVDSAEPWVIMDSMRGWVNQSSGAISLRANSDGSESAYGPWGPTATGWELDLNQREIDQNEQNYIYIAIRRPDGYVGKPPSVGTDVFAMDTQIANGYPMYISNFVVDYALHTDPTYSGSWEGDRFSVSRLQGPDTLITNGTGSEQSGSWQHWDYNNGFGENGSASYTDWQAWMWKRHAGLDVVTYDGNGTAGRVVPHNLSKSPEMMWFKRRDDVENWAAGHKGLNGGTNPWNYTLYLNTTTTETQSSIYFNNTAPTSTHFTLGSGGEVNINNGKYLAMLFASVDGISKVGYYNGSSSEQDITTGFQPRFIIIKRTDAAYEWVVLDTTRGWVSGDDKFLKLDANSAQTNHDLGEPLSNGFRLFANETYSNANGGKFIYYCHA